MPFTPFHMGAGMAAKAVLDGRISLIAFGVAQVLMDIEPGVRMLHFGGDLHGWSHTLPGALAIGALATVLSPLLIESIVRRLNAEAKFSKVSWLCSARPPRRWAVALGAYVGTLSHLFLDGLMHRDMHPFAPFTNATPFFGLLDHDNVYRWCAIAGLAFGIAWLVRKRMRV